MRRMFRGVRSVRGTVLSIISVVVLFLWMGPSLFVRNPHAPDPQAIHDLGPMAILGLVVLIVITSGSDAAITFSAAETDLLFPGPFTRRQLLLYKVAKVLLAALGTSLIFSFVLLRLTHN